MKKFILLVTLSAIIFLGAYLYYISGVYKKNFQKESAGKFFIQEGESSEEISENLEKQGIIKNSLFFNIYAWQAGLDGKLQAGEYDIPQNSSIADIIKLLSSKKFRPQKKITIIEGWRNLEIADYLDKNGVAQKDEFLKEVSKIQDWQRNYDFLGDLPQTAAVEGYLFPDTYLIFEGAPIDAVIKKMLDNFSQKITQQMKERMGELDMTLHEVVTLASIIEKEVSASPDRVLVSGIFHKRLKYGIGLQADSTVNYITGKNTTRSSLNDISIDNPYNTYKYRGLPPGPIGNPGLESILAALYPKDSEYLFFLTTSEGKAIYSRTFEEHIAAKNKYLR